MMKSLVLVAAGVLLSGGAVGAYGVSHHAHTTGQVSLGTNQSATSSGAGSKGHWGKQRFGMMGGGNLMADAAKALNISTSTLQADMKAGDSLSTIAANNGSSASALEATLLSDAKAQIQSAVSSGKLTSAQATKIGAQLSKMIDNFVTMKPGSMPSHSMGGMGTLMGTLQNDVAKALNISTSTLQADLKSGDSLSTIASNNGSSATALENALTADATTEINSLMSSGKLTSSQATSIEANLSKMIDAYVTHKPGSMPQRGGMMGGFMKGMMSDVAKALNISTSTLQADIKSGESLSTIASNNGSSATALESALTADATTEINSLVSSGKLTSTQATSIEANVGQMIDNFVTKTPGTMTNGGFHGWGGGWGKNSAPQSSTTKSAS